MLKELICLTLSVLCIALECPSHQNYIKLVKKNCAHPDEEIYTISIDDVAYITTEPMIKNEVQTFEYCINKTINDQYELQLSDEYTNGWDSGSWLEISGLYGNIVFKGYCTDNVGFKTNLSLLYPIRKQEQWKFTNSFSSSWFSYDYDDANWKTITLGDCTEETSGVQYFRKVFSGIAALAAYEVRFNYKFGIVAYINGNEIYRMNMAPGVVYNTTYATGQYTIAEYRGIIRTGIEVSDASNVLSVEIHPLAEMPMLTILFDAWLAVYGKSIKEENCYVYPYTVNLTASDGDSPSSAFDFDDQSDYTIMPWNGQEGKLTYAFSPDILPVINAMLMNPSSRRDTSITSFSIGGSSTIENPEGYTLIETFYEQNYKKYKWYISPLYKNSYYYNYLRFFFLAGGSELCVYEAAPSICNIEIPVVLDLSETVIKVSANVEEVSIYATTTGVNNCTVEPSLPQGLTLNSNSCRISGIVTIEVNETIFTMTAHNLNIQGTFSLTVDICKSTVMIVERSYPSQGNLEGECFKIIDLITNKPVIEVSEDMPKVPGTVWTRRICAIHGRYEVDLSNNRYWIRDSYLYIYAELTDGEKEHVLTVRADSEKLVLPTSYNIDFTRPINVQSSWYYFMNSVPTNWNSDDYTNWNEGKAGSIPPSTNHIQLYKKTFIVASLEHGGAFSLTVRYKYGIVIYMNTIEVFRNHLLTGDISSETIATGVYNELRYRTITLPYRTITTLNEPFTRYLKEGVNSIAIGLVGMNPNRAYDSTFDMTIRLFGDTSLRNMNYLPSFEGIEPYCKPFSLTYLDICKTKPGVSNYIQIQYRNERREWISSIVIQSTYNEYANLVKNITIEARNSEDEAWTTLAVISDMKWWVHGQKQKIYLENNKAYNIYRISNITGDTPSCKTNNIMFFSDRIDSDIPDLSYPSTIINGYKNVEFAEIYPCCDQYRLFRVEPKLPEGLDIDPIGGIIIGTPVELVSNKQVTVHAKKISGVDTSFNLIFNIIHCTGDKGLITVSILTDTYAARTSFKLVKGRDIDGEVVKHVPQIKQTLTLIYEDFCLPASIYTFAIMDSMGAGWTYQSGYSLSIDQGKLRFDLHQIPNRDNSIVVVPTVFSSLLPFQINFSLWKVAPKTQSIPSDWTSLNYDDSLWIESKAMDIDGTSEKGLYIRKAFDIPNLVDYQVMNVRVRYLDGLRCYFNGKIIARFNMQSVKSEDTIATSTHDPSLFSSFSVIIAIAGGLKGTNIIAFEMHRASETSTSIPYQFDASAVFGVDTCSPLVNSIQKVSGSSTTSGLLTGLFDMYMKPVITFNEGSTLFIKWTLENLEQVYFNTFSIRITKYQPSIFYNLQGIISGKEEVSIYRGIDDTLLYGEINNRETPIGLIGFNSFKLTFTSQPVDVLQIMELVLTYCKTEGGICPGIDNYPAVTEGQISPALCPHGFYGYSYRNCTNGQLSDIITDRCIYRFPANLQYSKQFYTFVMNTHVTTDRPTYDNIIEEYYIANNSTLPDGLFFDTSTGEIFGIPLSLTDSTVYTIIGENPKGATSVTISITVRLGYCVTEGVWGKTEVGTTAIYECSTEGTYLGSKHRKCILGKKDGVWQKETGFCIAIVILIIIIIAAIIILIIMISIIMYMNKHKKAVKGKKTTKTTMKTQTRKASKQLSKNVTKVKV